MKKNLLFLIFCTCIGFGQDVGETSKQFQEQLNKDFANADKTPLEKTDLSTFKSLDFFSINDAFIVKAQLILTKDATVFEMKTTTSRLPKYKKYGELIFKINTTEYKLNVYINLDLIKKEGYEDYLFLPFSDLTSGKESYIGGRYIDLRISNSDEMILDFNKAYNPYCAYSSRFSCPLVPLENQLEVAILAGVKKFHD